jgi:peptidoglycan hydrolase-like protein with peptidoglycan-binding domain
MNMFQVAFRAYQNRDRIMRAWALGKPIIDYANKHGDELGKILAQLQENLGLKEAPAKAGLIPAAYDVEWIQRTLNNDLGLDIDVDGDYGPATKDAVTQFQRKYGLTPVDGWVGPVTAEKMETLPPKSPGS